MTLFRATSPLLDRPTYRRLVEKYGLARAPVVRRHDCPSRLHDAVDVRQHDRRLMS